MYANFVSFLSSPSSWESFMRTDETRSRAQIHLQLRARALLFDKACVSLFPRSNRSSPSSNSKLNPNCNSHHILLDKFFVIFVLRNIFRGLMFLLCSLHGDDVYYTLENPTQNVAQPSKLENHQIVCEDAYWVFLKNGACFRLNIRSQRQPFPDVGFLISRILINMS
ncbi:hypothetical protein Hanom_Chr08g00685851 [Helianthus anomalus]